MRSATNRSIASREGRLGEGLGTFARVVAALVLSVPAWGQASEASEGSFAIGLESGPLRFSRNDVRIPGDGGTEFDMTGLTGSEAEFLRVEARWQIDERHGVRLVLAPLEVSGSGQLAEETGFAGETFAAGASEGTYRFNAYKLTYRYTFADRRRWRWGAGFTALVRDAEIRLRQGDSEASDDDLGFVPALHVSGDYRLGDRWSVELDFDGLAGGPGRLFDVAVKLDYELGANWHVGGGYRTLEGGADTDEVFNFAWLNYAVLSIAYRR